jgi:hypothetical protein
MTRTSVVKAVFEALDEFVPELPQEITGRVGAVDGAL